MNSAALPAPDRSTIEALLRTDFLSFLRKVFEELCPGHRFYDGWHLEAIAYQLDQVFAGKRRRLITTMPPRHLKSITISVASVAWCLGKAPHMRLICVSYNNELAAKLARDCRQVMLSDWYRSAFPGVEISRATEMEIDTTAGGGRFATSIGGTLTGRGGDVIIIDDPMKADDAFSDAVRQQVRDWTTSTLFSRLNDKSTGAIILVMQRLHEDDLAGYFLERGGWEHLNLPAIAEEEQRLLLLGDRIHERRVGDILHPARESLEVLDGIRRDVGSHMFSAQYQQAPVPAGGALIKRDWLRRYQVAPKVEPGDLIVQSWDTASKGGALNDYSACVTALVRKETVYILDAHRRQLDFPDLVRTVRLLADRYSPDILLIEDAASGQQLIQVLNESDAGGPRPIACKPESDKVTRMSACSALIESGGLVLPEEAPWLAPFEREILAFPHGKHDDQADALSQLLSWVRGRPKLLACPAVIMEAESAWFSEE